MQLEGKNMSNTWECPICYNNAYQRVSGPPVGQLKSFGQYFQCKGCSVMFANPKMFCYPNIAEKRAKSEKSENSVDKQ